MPPVTLTADLADRVDIMYTCGSGHEFTRTFATDIVVPKTWECPHCGQTGCSNSMPISETSRAAERTHWDMVLERRSLDELATALNHHLKDIRAGIDPLHP